MSNTTFPNVICGGPINKKRSRCIFHMPSEKAAPTPLLMCLVGNAVVQGDNYTCSKPPIDFKTKVLFRPGQGRTGQAKAELLFWSQREVLNKCNCHPVIRVRPKKAFAHLRFWARLTLGITVLTASFLSRLTGITKSSCLFFSRPNLVISFSKPADTYLQSLKSLSKPWSNGNIDNIQNQIRNLQLQLLQSTGWPFR